MRPDQWDRARQLFVEALERPGPARRAFLEGECGDDPEVLAQVEELLGHHRESFLDREKLARELTRALPEELPDSIAGYRILRELGRGGMGIVYEAEQVQPVRRKVAIKVIRGGMSTEQVVARFNAERQALAVMSHPGIARVYEAGADGDGRPYFVMEYVEGESITAWCDARRLSVRRRLELFLKVCEAVHHAHQKGIIHRDLKPSNVLVSEQEGQPAPKIIDFGIAKATDKSFTEATMLTEMHQLVGTLGYMSPEQARLTGQGIDTRTDVYSLGVILYELLVGSPPFDPQTEDTAFDELLRQIRETDPPRPSSRLRQLGEGSGEVTHLRQTDSLSYIRELQGDLDWIVMMALEKAVDRRYASAAELAADVRRHLEHEPVLARPPAASYRIGKFVRRHRAGVALTSVVILSLVAGIVATSVSLVRARRAEADARSSEAVATAEAASAEAVAAYMVEIFESGDAGRTGGDRTLREILDARSETIREDLAGQPRALGRILSAMGKAYTGIRESSRALALLEEALPLLKQAYGTDHDEVYNTLNELGRAANALKNFDKAESYFREAMEIGERIYGQEHENLPYVLANLGETLIELGRRGEARPFLERALAIREKLYGESSPAVGRTLSKLAKLLAREGDTKDAVDLARRALDIRIKSSEPGDRSIGFGHFYLGEALAADGQCEAAIENFKAARENWVVFYGPSHSNIGECHWETAKCLQRLGQSEAAYQEFESARDILLAGEDHIEESDAPGFLAWTSQFASFLADLGREAESRRYQAEAAGLRKRFGL